MDVHCLEPSLVHDALTTVLCEVIVYDMDQQKHVLKTALKGVFVRFEGYLPSGSTIVLLSGAQAKQTERGFNLIATDSTEIFPRPYICFQSLRQVVEVCSGAGFMGFGFEHCGFEISLRCDHAQTMLDLASHLHKAPVALGDVCTDSLLHPICQSQAGTIASGIACQPYSKLGDQKHDHDSRSLTLPGVLRLGFLGRFGAIVLECVATASTCPWFQSVLKRFTEITGYRISQGVLNLQTIWPSRRSRWWCILTHPSIGCIPWQPMPTVTTVPIIADLLDRFKVCTEEELKQLALDLYELGRFGAYGFEQNEIPWRGQMPTSLHSCGSQLGLCPCGCRMFPFCDDRLIAKGLHGLLVRLEDTVRCGYKEYQCYRHVHPAELALFQWDDT